MRFSFISTGFLIVSLTLLLSACSLQKEASVRYQSKFDFDNAHAYSFFSRNASINDHQNISHVLRNNIEFAVEQVMDDAGFRYSELLQSDIIVAYYLIESHGDVLRSGINRQALNSYNQGVKYCEYCLKARLNQSGKKRWRIDAGSLIIDLLDTQTKRSVWRSVYPLKIKAKDNSQKVQEKLISAISQMLTQYPSTAV